MTILRHSHRRAELAYVLSGMLSFTAGDAIYNVPPQTTLLIPAGTVHDMRVHRDSSVMTLYLALPPDKAKAGRLGTIPVSGLLREMMMAAASLPEAYVQESRDGLLMDLIAEEVLWLMSQQGAPTLQIPAPRDPRLLRLCQEALGQLERDWTIDQAARVAGMGRRTFTRSFRREIGISFNTWRARARLNAAVSRLSAGASITEVAFESGYNSPSAFATMFKRTLGMSPSQLRMASTNARHGGDRFRTET
ncbi:AraC family transcriptional regulator [Sphingomonas sp. HITSZ_GF]|uniref:AraC family transcriptional regulator n=1 Tax=Sphingomonas sp. HITSZ_GF TaxID=3037247 RepID=UPI00240D5BE8|nr:AraC family transcriptional regulator [Sphingomonas sp. HITSZ_GF]MDG2533843.1 AraC family transcriptional regulator [Sphingomonas sp. HITSZ_GF]